MRSCNFVNNVCALSGLDAESGEQAGFTQSRVGCDDCGGSGGDCSREVKRIKAAEAHRAVRAPQTANEVRRFESNFGAQRRQDDSAAGAVSIEAGDHPARVGTGDVPGGFLAIQGGSKFDAGQKRGQQRA